LEHGELASALEHHEGGEQRDPDGRDQAGADGLDPLQAVEVERGQASRGGLGALGERPDRESLPEAGQRTQPRLRGGRGRALGGAGEIEVGARQEVGRERGGRGDHLGVRVGGRNDLKTPTTWKFRFWLRSLSSGKTVRGRLSPGRTPRSVAISCATTIPDRSWRRASMPPPALIVGASLAVFE